jgi:hypothetical protein
MNHLIQRGCLEKIRHSSCAGGQREISPLGLESKSHPHRFQHRQGLALVVARVLFIWTESVMNVESKPYNLDIPKGPEHSSKKVTRSKMPKGATCFAVDSGLALSSKKLLFSGKRQGYRMKRKEDATNYFVRQVQIKKV